MIICFRFITGSVKIWNPTGENAMLLLDKAVKRYGAPKQILTDQGTQFTGKAFTGLLEQHGIQISMDGRGSYQDNLFIERLWRTVKYEEVYLKSYRDGKDARIGLGNYFRFYNTERPHQALGCRTPAEVFTLIPVEATNGSMVESLTLDTLMTAGPTLNIVPILS
jgi:putative transposase